MVTLLPTLYLNHKRIDKALTKTDYAGWGIWLFGFLFEVIADQQKMSFKSDKKNQVNRFKFVLLEIKISFCVHSGKIY